MEDSILNTIKKMLGIDESDKSFDLDIITNINSAFNVLKQLGVGPEEGFMIEDAMDEWEDYTDSIHLNDIKTYIYLKVRKVFDPPQNSTVMEALNSAINELEWRINIEVDTDYNLN